MPKINLRDDPSQKHLDYFAQDFLIPTLSDKRTELIDIGKGKAVRLPKYEYSTYTSKLPKRFSYKDRKWKPRKMFFNQRKGFKKITGRYSQKKVNEAIKKATKMPEMTFSLKPVALIKPSYGEVV